MKHPESMKEWASSGSTLGSIIKKKSAFVADRRHPKVKELELYVEKSNDEKSNDEKSDVELLHLIKQRGYTIDELSEWVRRWEMQLKHAVSTVKRKYYRARIADASVFIELMKRRIK